MHGVTIHYDRIGTIPQVEPFRDVLAQLILSYEGSAPSPEELAALTRLTGDDRRAYVDALLEDDRKMQRIVDGLTITFCAEHFYGLLGQEFNSMSDLIDALRGLDDNLKAK